MERIMEKKVVKLGIVGLGRGSYVMKDILFEPSVKVTAICDRNLQLVDETVKYLEEKEFLYLEKKYFSIY